MEAIFGFFKVVVICASAVVGLFLVLLALPRSPVRDFAFSLTKRLGVTAAGAMIFLPIDVVPVVGEIGDLLIAGAVIYYWYTFFKHIGQMAEGNTNRVAHPEDTGIIDATTIDDQCVPETRLRKVYYLDREN